MDLMQAMKERHSVRAYKERHIEENVRQSLNELIACCNQEGGLRIQACFDEPRAFNSMMAHYGKFKNVKNYIALVGPKDKQLEEKCGYYGEKLVQIGRAHV